MLRRTFHCLFVRSLRLNPAISSCPVFPRVVSRINVRALCLFLFAFFAIGAHHARADLLLSSFDTNQVLRYDDITGAYIGVFASGNGLDRPLHLTYGPDHNIYVSNLGTASVLRYNATGGFLGTFASGILTPTGSQFGPDGNFYVVSDNGHRVLRFDGTTGAPLGTFAMGGLNRPQDLTFGPDGNLYVTGNFSNNIVRFDGTTGAFLGTFASVNAPTGLIFGPDRNLYVTSNNPGNIFRFDGTTGASLGAFAIGGGLLEPAELAFGPDGNLYVANDVVGSAGDGVLRYNGTTGQFMGTFASGGGLSRPLGMVFTPSVPEPSSLTLALMGTGIVGFIRYWRGRGWNAVDRDGGR